MAVSSRVYPWLIFPFGNPSLSLTFITNTFEQHLFKTIAPDTGLLDINLSLSWLGLIFIKEGACSLRLLKNSFLCLYQSLISLFFEIWSI